MLEEVDASAVLWTTGGREMCVQTNELLEQGRGWGREDAGLGLSPPVPSTQDTWNMQNSDQRNSGKMEGE